MGRLKSPSFCRVELWGSHSAHSLPPRLGGTSYDPDEIRVSVTLRQRIRMRGPGIQLPLAWALTWRILRDQRNDSPVSRGEQNRTDSVVSKTGQMTFVLQRLEW